MFHKALSDWKTHYAYNRNCSSFSQHDQPSLGKNYKKPITCLQHLLREIPSAILPFYLPSDTCVFTVCPLSVASLSRQNFKPFLCFSKPDESGKSVTGVVITVSKVWPKWEVCTKRDRRRVIRPAPRVNLLSRGLVCLLATRRPEKTIRSCFPSPSSNPIMSCQEQQTDKAKELCQSCSKAGRELLIKGTQDGRVLVSKPQPELMPGRCMPLWTNEGATSAPVYQTLKCKWDCWNQFWEANNITQ